jgi:hypothetical protein
MSLPFDLQKLPPQAVDVLRFLDAHGGSADVDTIMEGTGLSERMFGKAIRRLVTRSYVEMPEQGLYVVATKGEPLVQQLREYDGTGEPGDSGDTPTITDHGPAEIPAGSATSGSTPSTTGPAGHERRLSVVINRELVISSTAVLMAGFDAPAGDSLPLAEPARVVLRVSAPDCDLSPAERPLEVEPDTGAGPARFELTPRREGRVRIKVEVLQLVAADTIHRLGGMFFDLNVAGFPTPKNAELQTLSTSVALRTNSIV